MLTSGQDHPWTNTPCFFIHPCQTTAVIEASAGDRSLSPVEYLVMWIGALGACVGFNVPLEMFTDEGEQNG
jgi:ubiquitin-like-conjugating enzyme ATG10